MAKLPNVPSFTTGDTSLLKLQQLAQAVTFIIDCDVKPAAHMYRTSVSPIGSLNTWKSQDLNEQAWLSDAVYVSPGITIETQGYYSIEGHIGFGSQSNPNGYLLRLLLTAGSNNPLGSGATVPFGMAGGQAVQSASQDTDICVSALSPGCLYVGDQIFIQALVTTILTDTNYNQNTNYLSGRFVPNLTAIWVRKGP